MEHLCALKVKGVFCTPIFSKYYWFDEKPTRTLKEWRNQFELDMKLYMNEAYLENLKWLLSMPSPILKESFLGHLEMIEKEKYPKAIETLLYYGDKWNCRKK